MKRTLVAVLALAMAAPVVTIPVAADAQVLTGRGAARQAPRRPSLSEAELNRLYDAEDEVSELDGQISDIRAAGESAGGLSADQQRQIAALTARRDAAQRTVDRLEAKRNR